jgi:hypothetical protein
MYPAYLNGESIGPVTYGSRFDLPARCNPSLSRDLGQCIKWSFVSYSWFRNHVEEEVRHSSRNYTAMQISWQDGYGSPIEDFIVIFPQLLMDEVAFLCQCLQNHYNIYE